MPRRWSLVPAYLALSFNLVVLTSVAADLRWVRTRAAGGSFLTFPIWLRLIYAAQVIFMLVLMGMLRRTIGRPALALAVLFFVSTVLQLASRSSDERWNAAPAAVLALTYARLVRAPTHTVKRM